YGNPYIVGVDGTRFECVQMFEKKVLPHLDVEPLRGLDLICHCAPQNCHGYSIFAKLYGKKDDSNKRSDTQGAKRQTSDSRVQRAASSVRLSEKGSRSRGTSRRVMEKSTRLNKS